MEEEMVLPEWAGDSLIAMLVSRPPVEAGSWPRVMPPNPALLM